MKTFEDICRMSQADVKAYMKEYLNSNGYSAIDEDGFLYAKGTVPVLLVAHMDTVHKEMVKETKRVGDKLSSPQGIGGDDRCGVFIIMNLVKELHCSVLLCEDEEKGTVGARKFTKAKYKTENSKKKTVEVNYIDNLDVNYMIEFDRKGSNDAVFYTCDNAEFTDFVTDVTGFKKAYGSYSDISVLMPAAKLAAVNLSSGYYNPHTVDEYVMYDEMMDTMEAAKVLIKEECKKPFKYVERKYTPMRSPSYYDYSDYYGGYYGRGYNNGRDGMQYYGNMFKSNNHRDSKLYELAKDDKEIELEVVTRDIDNNEDVTYAKGSTKAECWMNMFLENPDMCFNDIIDYNWC